MSKFPPLPIRIPSDYARLLGVDETVISRWNNGVRKVPFEKACLLLSMAKKDPRLKGLTIYQMCPELLLGKRFLCPEMMVLEKLQKKIKESK